ncbi:MAG TPA: hypothetical protein VEU96_14615 [Bryobacteraceae bacterium]|nr:hypothetical protein [Bryobacteraceae bacterium]
MKRLAHRGGLSAGVVVCALGLVDCSYFSDPKNEPSAKTVRPAEVQNFSALTPDQWLNLSLTYYQQHKYLESIAAAQTAVYLRPDYAEAYNNIGAAYAALHLWDPAIQADRQALRCRPDFPLARNNLAWAMEQKRLDIR